MGETVDMQMPAAAGFPSLWARIREFLPEGRTLPERDWVARHNGIMLIIWAHVFLLPLFGLWRGWSPLYALGESALIGVIGALAAWNKLGRRFRSAASALALVTCSAVFVQFWGGYIEGHFHFFIVVAIVVLYQDWVPFILSVAYVALDHGLVGTLAPSWVYNHPDAIAHPWTWALFHAILVLGECAALIYAWKMTEKTRSQVDLLMNAAGEAILGVDNAGRVAFANPAASTVTGRDMESLLGQSIQDVLVESINGTRHGELFASWADVYESGDNKHVLRPDGSTLPVNWARSPMREHGQVVGHVVTLLDATPQKLAEEERRKRLEQLSEVERLKELNQFKTLFINSAAHELHTPLTPLRLNVFALKEGHKGVLNAGQKEVVEVLERNVDRLSQLVEDVLNAAKLQANKMTIVRTSSDLHEVAEDAVATFRETARQKKVALELRAQPDVSCPMDARRVGQVLYNLLDNAFKFTPSGGKVTVEVARGDGGAIVRVRDNGVGIPVQDQERLFQPFSQAHDTMQYTRSGSGLGLYISRGIIELHGGRIWCESDGAGRGSTFCVTLPTTATVQTKSSPALAVVGAN